MTLRHDVECLMRFPKRIVKGLGWDLDKPVCEWKRVKVSDGRITELRFYDLGITSKEIKKFVLPSGLLVLNLFKNEIDAEGIRGLILPPGLKTLYLSDNNIGDEGMKRLVLPPGLETLDLSNIGITGLSGIVLPLMLKYINIMYNNIVEEDIDSSLMLPKGLITVLSGSVSISLKMMMSKRSDEYSCFEYQRIRDDYQKWWDYHNTLRSRVLQEICRGLSCGETEDPIFKFLKNTSGMTGLRHRILKFYTIQD